MKKHSRLIISSVLALAFLLSACGNNTPAVTSAPPNTDVPPNAGDASAAPATSSPIETSSDITTTPDPCAPENIEAEVMKVHRHMREFDDASSLAASLERTELVTTISDLQRIRRESEEQVIPYCLGDLKASEINHMNTVINTLIAFMSKTDQKIVDQGIALARQQHDQYALELARVLGLTVEAVTAVPTFTQPPETATPNP